MKLIIYFILKKLKKTKNFQIENHKIFEQNKYLQSEDIEAEKQLKKFLLGKDNSEFAQDNVE